MNDKEPLRILHIPGSMEVGGVQSMIMNLYRRIDRTKIQFDFIYFCNETCHYDDEITQMGGRIFHCPSIKEVGVIRSLKILTQIIQKGKYQYEVVHVHTQFNAGLSLLAARLAGVKKRICHAHSTSDAGGDHYFRSMYRYMMRMLIRFNSTLKLACGELAGQYLYGSKESVRNDFTVFPNAIDLSQYDFIDVNISKAIRHKLGISEKELVLGNVSRFAEEKNHNFLIAIVEQLKKRIEEFKLILVGDGPLFEDIKQLVKKKGLEKHVLFLGVRSDVNQLMNIFDVFLLPSRYEGVALVLIEAQAAGIKSVVSTGVPKEVDMGIGGIQFISLENDISIWIDEILAEARKPLIDKEAALRNLIDRGYDITEGVKRVASIYANDKQLT
ncbi:Glycosyltransferase involved in cell wall bisynthesis [Paenibacillus sp. yr247]|uniref:glycosyltransferase family 1 protein n=1 Tax=Paenibacillus sp. yr247 TaxID=1761880 RepID=UPI00088578FE|nr:glycosyltransferase family 1 protein [Paenibacillus sp. yr247]SDN32386.1 Glycosyltransferase involved in cell wall bisynthesis [Paenibacillus sp. yr247]